LGHLDDNIATAGENSQYSASTPSYGPDTGDLLSESSGTASHDELVADAEIHESDSHGETVYVIRSAPASKRIRLDLFIAKSIESASRTKVQNLIAEGRVRVNEEVVTKPGRPVGRGDVVFCISPKPPPPAVEAENIPLDIRYEDDAVLVVNKPAGMVTHPAHGNRTGTLVHALLWHTANLSLERGRERAGIIHRLDKGTSGLLCVARTDEAHRSLSRQFAERTIDREYIALVWGSMSARKGLIDAPLARHPSDRKRMAVVEGGRTALTEYTVLHDFGCMSLLRLRLRTGRTHQIRVHLAHLRHPVFGDPTYGGRRILYGAVTGEYKRFIGELLELLPRQGLHARTLGFEHPVTGERVLVEAEPPQDMQQAMERAEAWFSGR